MRLGDSFQVRAVSRDPERIRSYFSGKPSIELFRSELKGEGAGAGLRTALEGAHGLVICTGTTAFPTRAWSPDGKRDVTMPVLRALVEARLDLRKAVAALDAQGFNTPRQIDALANLAVLDAWRAAAGDRRKRCVFMSSIGVQRRQQMPFPVLNACGVLDAKAEAEAALKADAVRARPRSARPRTPALGTRPPAPLRPGLRRRRPASAAPTCRQAASGYDACIVRPGQLFGGPYDNNYYLGTLFQLDKDANTRGVAMARGDTLIGDTLRSTLAEA